MADQTICMACLPQKKKESCSISNNLPPGPGSCGCNHHGDKVVLVEDHADTVCSCSTLCDGIGDNTKQYNGIQQPETGFLFSNSKDVKESKNVKKFRADCKEHGCMSSMCLSQVCQSQASHTSTNKINSLDKCNGLTHQHIGDEYYAKKNVCDVVNVPNIKYNGEEAVGNHGNEINSLKRDSDSEPCHCTAKVDSDYVSCDEIEAENIHSPEMHCHNNCSVNTTLLTNFERISIHQLNNASEHYTVSDDVINGITYAVYESEKQMPDIMRLITKDLSEPYSIYTYRYFIHNWPKLCFLALCDTHCIGAIVCKLDSHKKMVRRGYIAMLAVDSEYRRRKIGSILVTKAIEAMIRDDCDEVVLETEITNQSALHLYENLGFVRDKRLFRYYLNGVDALRLKLWLR